MRVVAAGAYGGPDVLRVEEHPLPEPGPGMVRIRVMAAGVNFADILQREGRYPGGPEPPFVPGFEVAGVIDAAGPKTGDWQPGAEVTGLCSEGYAEYALAPAAMLLAKPEPLSFHQATAIPCQYMTAYHAVLTAGQVREGQTVVITAAAGGVGSLAAQIARINGARVVGLYGGQENKRALLERLGAAHVIDYGQPDYAARVAEASGGPGCDLLIDGVGGEVFSGLLGCLRPRGVAVTLGGASGSPAQITTRQLIAGAVTVTGLHLGVYMQDGLAMSRARRNLASWLKTGELTIVAQDAFPLEEADRAHQAITERATTGKVALLVGGGD